MANMTGNPMVDMMSVFSMMYGASGAAATPLGLVLNANTAMTVISGEHANFVHHCSSTFGASRRCTAATPS
jgi:hypothetical protein